MTTATPVYPFTAIVGQDKMKLALILNVINPGLSGVLIRGEKGTAKSTAVRALADILPEIDVFGDDPFQLSPEEEEEAYLEIAPHLEPARWRRERAAARCQTQGARGGTTRGIHRRPRGGHPGPGICP